MTSDETDKTDENDGENEEESRQSEPAEPPSKSPALAVPDDAWGKPRPYVIPRATYWPAMMAFGITFLLWGFVTSLVVLFAGVIVFAVSLAGWIGEMRHEQEEA